MRKKTYMVKKEKAINRNRYSEPITFFHKATGDEVPRYCNRISRSLTFNIGQAAVKGYDWLDVGKYGGEKIIAGIKKGRQDTKISLSANSDGSLPFKLIY